MISPNIKSGLVRSTRLQLRWPVPSSQFTPTEIIYGGEVHFSKELLESDNQGTIYGIVVEQLAEGWGEPISGMYLKSLSQEHGVVSVPESLIREYKIGDLLYILPVHSCMTANEMKGYYSNAEIITRL